MSFLPISLLFSAVFSLRYAKEYQYDTENAKIVHFDKFDPRISLRIVLLGFDPDTHIENSVQYALNSFLSSKKFGRSSFVEATAEEPFEKHLYINLSLKFSVINLQNQEFMNSYSQLLSHQDKTIRITRNSEFTNIFSNLHAKAILNSKNNEKYTLFFVNYSEPLDFFYENSTEETNCILFEFNSAFCNISPFDNSTRNDKDTENQILIGRIFEGTSKFLDTILVPDVIDANNLFMRGPNKVIAPIVTFGPKIQLLSTLQREMSSLFRPIDSVVIANRQDLYDFPLVSTLLRSDPKSLFYGLRHSEHVFGSFLDTEFSSQTSLNSSENFLKVCPIYVFNSTGVNMKDFITNSKSDKMSSNDTYISILFSSDNELLEKNLLSTIARVAGNVNFFAPFSEFQPLSRTSYRIDSALYRKLGNCIFGGHHPFSTYGGVPKFSSIFSDVIIRNYALSNMLIAYRNYYKAELKIEKAKQSHLSFINASFKRSNLETLQRMIVRTSSRINNNEFAKALSSSTKAIEASNELLKEAEKLLLEASVFGNCCTETIYVARPINHYVVFAIIVSFLCALAFALYRLCVNMRMKRYIPKALY